MRDGVIFDAENLPPLPGYISAAEAAGILGVSKATLLDYVYSGRFKKAYRLGNSGRPSVVLVEEEVKTFQRGRPPTLLERRSAWRKRAVAWAEETGWSKLPISRKGFLPSLLHWDYTEACPGDPYPVESTE